MLIELFLLCFLPHFLSITDAVANILWREEGNTTKTFEVHVCQRICDIMISVEACSQISTLCRMFFFVSHSGESQSLFSLQQNILKSSSLFFMFFPL